VIQIKDFGMGYLVIALAQAYEKTLAPYHIADVGTGLVRPSEADFAHCFFSLALPQAEA